VTDENVPLPEFFIKLELVPGRPLAKVTPPDGMTAAPPVPTVTFIAVIFEREIFVDLSNPPAPPPPPWRAPPDPPPAITK
jgi:hypothetical protein